MKILHVIDTLDIGGAQSLLLEIAPLQKSNGHIVDVLQLKSESNSMIYNKLKELGINVITLDKDLSLYNPLYIIKIIPYLKKYDIINVHLFPALYWVGFAKFFSRAKTPLVITEHSTGGRREKYFLLRCVDHFIYKHCYNCVIGCSDAVTSIFTKRHYDVKCVSIPNGVNIEKFTKAHAYSKTMLSETNPYILTMVARFQYPKRQDLLIKAISSLPSNFHLVLIGGERNDNGVLNAQQYCHKLNVDNRVHFLYTRSDVENLLKMSDINILASEYEGLSLSSIEAMASGKPFIASNVNGIKELVSGFGLLFDNSSLDSLLTIILKLYKDPIYYSEIANKCLMRSSMYDIKSTVNNYLSLYMKLIENE